MSNNHSGDQTLTYRPTSLEFINRPNPVEPHAVQEKHPLNGTPRLEKSAKDEFMRLLLAKNVERPAKRRKSGDAKLPDLPRLPAVRNGTKRLRIPPTLSGLHQPPPDAGLLPSMSMQQPLRLSDGPAMSQSEAVNEEKSTEAWSESAAKSTESTETREKERSSKRKHNKWSDEETACLLKGVAKFGIGQWTKILKCPEYHFEGRTGLDLKDRFRVCCPEEYKTSRKVKIDENQETNATEESANLSKQKARSRPKKSDAMSTSQLQNLGIDKPFEKSKRRQRTGYNEEEDEALLRGFKKHGNAWAAIRDDEGVLQDRTATDLRDRFRTRYPDEYAKAGLTPRPEQASKKVKQAARDETDDSENITTSDISRSAAITQKPAEKPPEKENKIPQPPASSKKPPPISLLQNDDVFWGAPFEPYDTDSEPITLDRGILDWAYDYDMQRPQASNENIGKVTGIDPLATLNLPRPTATASNAGGAGPTSGAGPQAANSSTINALPSLAVITAGSWHGGAEGVEEQLELPSLLGDFGGLESDGRTGGLSMEELLS